MNKEIAEILEHYENGLFTKPELVNRLIDFCIFIDPGEYVPYLPSELVDEMKSMVNNPPVTAEKIYFLGSVTYRAGRTETEIDLTNELEKVRAFGSAWRMHVYFNHA